MPAENLTEHEYDGIREYDNPCPAWWIAIFWATVAFSIVYFMFFHAGNQGWTVEQAYQTAVAENVRLQFGDLVLKGDENTMLQYMYPMDTKAKDWQALGSRVFASNCATCHGPDGAGLIGPNLTDDYYKNIKVLTDIPTTIENGTAGGNMPAWKNRLHPNEIVLVAAYVASLRGKNLPGKAKLPEDVLIAPWPNAAPLDTGKSQAVW